MSERVRHVINSGLIAGQYYNVYVTQVNNEGTESEKSLPSIIRVGDVTPPPIPEILLDTEYGADGCEAVEETVTLHLKWNPVVCDDINYYVLHLWTNENAVLSEGVFPLAELPNPTSSQMIPSGLLNAAFGNLQPRTYVYVGIQSIDVSRNASCVRLKKIEVFDKTVLEIPDAPDAIEYGCWAIQVSVKCPKKADSYKYKSVVIYRDGKKEICTFDYHVGISINYVDILDILDGLTHRYTVRFVTKTGELSPMSLPSRFVTAKAIDKAYIDNKTLEDLEDAWTAASKEEIENLKNSAGELVSTVKELAAQLKDVKEDYSALYNNYTVAANTIQFLSAKIEEQEKTISTLKTSITQNAESIKICATKKYVDEENAYLNKNMTAQLKVQADRISSVVATSNSQQSSITQLSNAMSLKVNSSDLAARIDLQISKGLSVAYIEADRIVLKGNMLMQGSARIQGRFYADSIALVNTDGSVVWGSYCGTVQPTVTDFRDSYQPTVYNVSQNRDCWYEFRRWSYTPSPPVNFNGMSRVKVTLYFTLRVYFTDSTWNPDWYPFLETRLRTSYSQYSTSERYIDREGTIKKNGDFGFTGTSYASYGGGWRITQSGGSKYAETQSFTIWTASLPIGQVMQFIWDIRNLGSYNLGYNNGTSDIRPVTRPNITTMMAHSVRVIAEAS